MIADLIANQMIFGGCEGIGNHFGNFGVDCEKVVMGPNPGQIHINHDVAWLISRKSRGCVMAQNE